MINKLTNGQEYIIKSPNNELEGVRVKLIDQPKFAAEKCFVTKVSNDNFPPRGFYIDSEYLQPLEEVDTPAINDYKVYLIDGTELHFIDDEAQPAYDAIETMYMNKQSSTIVEYDYRELRIPSHSVLYTEVRGRYVR